MEKHCMATHRTFEQHLIEFCAPTLASLKTASLFQYAYEEETELQEQQELWSRILENKGIRICVLRKWEQHALIYVYRPERLSADLSGKGVETFLKKSGYCGHDPKTALEHLKERIAESDTFPHEIGLFLSYPLGDVVGFIRNRGQNCKCVGCWKVYCNECEARRTFARYDKCTSVYGRLWREGRSVRDLTVAA